MCVVAIAQLLISCSDCWNPPLWDPLTPSLVLR